MLVPKGCQLQFILSACLSRQSKGWHDVESEKFTAAGTYPPFAH